MRSRRQQRSGLLSHQVSLSTSTCTPPPQLPSGLRRADGSTPSLFSAVCTGTAPASFVTPDPTTAASYVPNEYFSFPYVATSFANPGHCSAAISQCSANYEACTSQLAREDGSGGGGYAVTVVVPGGGGTTVTAGAGVSVDASAATSICKNLSHFTLRFLLTYCWRATGLRLCVFHRQQLIQCRLQRS